MNSRIFEKINLNLEYPMDKIISENCFIADISGNDSIAALIKVAEENPSAIIIPSIVELACEYGDKDQFSKVLKKLDENFSHRIMPGIISETNDLWKAIVVNNIQESVKLYGFYSPCITCHLVFHIIRIKIANFLNIKNVVSGERELHSNKEKINQVDFVLDFYNSLYNSMGIIHHLPLRYINDNNEVNKILEKYNSVSVQLNCLFAGNYYRKETIEFNVDKKQIYNYVYKCLPLLMETFDKQIIVQCKVYK